MMGLAIQRVAVAALLAACLLLAGYPPFHPSPAAFAATTEDIEAGSSKSEKEEQGNNNQGDQTEKTAPKKETQAQKETPEDTDLPPLDLGTGTTAKEKPPTEDVLATGVTATSEPKSPQAGQQSPAGSQSTPGHLDPKMLWTPNSGRFLLKDRQADLSLASSADTEDKGDGIQTSPSRTKPKAAKPKPQAQNPQAQANTKPKEPAPLTPTSAMQTPLDVPSQTSTEPKTPDQTLPADPGSFPAFVMDEEKLQARESPEPVSATDPDSQPDAGLMEQPPKETANLLWDPTQGEEQADEDGLEPGTIGVIRPHNPSADTIKATKPTFGGGSLFQDSGELGENVVGVSPWRGWSVFFLCLGLIFAAYWLSQKLRGKAGGLAGKTLSVIETIGIGAGRQILIVEMADDALIIGVTPHSINLLDKVPLSTLTNGYSSTVEGIISREGSAMPGQWESRPSFESAVGQAQLPPPIQSGTYGPSGQAQTSLGELRRTRQPKSGQGGLAQVEVAPPPQNAKDELIGRFRSQLNRFEE